MLSRAGAWSGEVSESDGATAQAFTGPKDFGPPGRCTHIGAGARRDRFSTIDERDRRCLREPAHGLQEQPRPSVGRGRRLPDLNISAPSVFARILAWARDATDFRPSRNGVGGACASRRTVWESGRERWRDGAGCYRTSGFRPSRSLHTCWCGRSMGQIFDHRETVAGVRRLPRTVGESVGERWHDGAGRLPDLGYPVSPMLCTHVGARSTRPIFDPRETAAGVSQLPRTVCESA